MNGIVAYDGKLNDWVIKPEVAEKMESLGKRWFEIFETLHAYRNCFDSKRVRGESVKGGIPATLLATVGDQWGTGQHRVLLSLEKNRLYLYHRFGFGHWTCEKEIDVKDGCFLELFRSSYFTLRSIQGWLLFWHLYLPVVLPMKIFLKLVCKHIISRIV